MSCSTHSNFPHTSIPVNKQETVLNKAEIFKATANEVDKKESEFKVSIVNGQFMILHNNNIMSREIVNGAKLEKRIFFMFSHCY